MHQNTKAHPLQKTSPFSPSIKHKIDPTFAISLSSHFPLGNIHQHGRGQLKCLRRYGDKGVAVRSNWWEPIGVIAFRRFHYAADTTLSGCLRVGPAVTCSSLMWRYYRCATEAPMMRACGVLIGRDERKICSSPTVSASLFLLLCSKRSTWQ